MAKTVWVYGIIAGAIIIVSMFVGLASGTDTEHIASLEWVGYLVMIAAFSLIFFGIKQYRDKELGGIIRFSTAFQVGLGITLIASLVYVVAWEASLALTDYAFIDDYTDSVVEMRKAEGISSEALAELEIEMQELRDSYAKVPYRLMMTFLEIFPVGLLITLLSSAVLRRSDVLPGSGSGVAIGT